MTDLTLYHAVPSRGMIVRWMLEELGEPYTVNVLDLAAGDQKRPDYLAVNPMGRVPALRHRDTIVTETAAICLYLADAFPQAGLAVPVGSPLRGPYLRWLRRCCGAASARSWRMRRTSRLPSSTPWPPPCATHSGVARTSWATASARPT
jgi:glutathione S-transferase